MKQEIHGLREKQENLVELCGKLEEIAIDLFELLEEGNEKIGNHDNIMTVILLHKQLDLLDAVMVLVAAKKGIVSYILIRTMLEIMSQLYYSKINPDYSKKWIHYQCVGNLRSVEKQKDIGIFPSEQEIKKLVKELKEHGYEYVQYEDLFKVKKCLEDGRLPLSIWYRNDPYKSTSSIISMVEDDILKKYDICGGKEEIKKGFRFLYQELSNITHPSPNGMEDLYYLEDNCLKIKSDHLLTGVKALILAIELMARTVDIANVRFKGSFGDVLNIIANETERIVKWLQTELLSKNI